MNFPLLCNINLKIETKKRSYGKSHLTLASLSQISLHRLSQLFFDYDQPVAEIRCFMICRPVLV